jgi:hypothetical protein
LVCVRRGVADDLKKKITTASLIFYNYKKKYSASEEMDENCHIFANIHWAILPSLLLAHGLISWIFNHTQPMGTFAQRVSMLFPRGSQYPLRIAQRLSNNL